MKLQKVQINLTAKQKKHLIIGLVALVVLIAIILIVKKMKKAKQARLQGDFSAINPGTEAKEVALPNDNFPLQKGSRGKRVEQVQLYLIKKKGAQFTKFGADGIWGGETEANVRAYLNVTQIDEPLFNSLRMTDYKTFKYA